MAVQVTDHARQLMEKHMQKPFFDGGYAGSTPRMSAEEVQEGMAWVDDRFFPIRYEDEALPSVDWVLNVAKAAVLRSPVPHPSITFLGCCTEGQTYLKPLPLHRGGMVVLSANFCWCAGAQTYLNCSTLHSGCMFDVLPACKSSSTLTH